MNKRINVNMPQGYSIKIVRNIEEIEEIREAWVSMQWHPNSDVDWYLTVINLRDQVYRPHILTLYKKNKPVTMLIGKIENLKLEFKIGYKVFLRPTMRSLTVTYGGILGESTEENMKIIFEELINYLRDGEIDVIFFNQLKLKSDLYNLATTVPSFLCRDHFPVTNPHWIMTMPGNIEEFFKKLDSKTRRRIRQKTKELEKDYRGQAVIKVFAERNQVEQVCNDAEHVDSKTYHRGLGVGFIYNKENFSSLNLHAERGGFRAYILYINEIPCSFWIGTLYNNVFYLHFTGYDPKYKKNEIGTVSFSKMMEDLCTLKDIKMIDFGFGDALYKSHLCDTNWQEASVYIFKFSLKGVTINLIKTVNVILTKLIEIFLKKTNLFAPIKRWWRNSLVSPDANPS